MFDPDKDVNEQAGVARTLHRFRLACRSLTEDSWVPCPLESPLQAVDPHTLSNFSNKLVLRGRVPGHTALLPDHLP